MHVLDENEEKGYEDDTKEFEVEVCDERTSAVYHMLREFDEFKKNYIKYQKIAYISMIVFCVFLLLKIIFWNVNDIAKVVLESLKITAAIVYICANYQLYKLCGRRNYLYLILVWMLPIMTSLIVIVLTLIK